MKAKQNLFVTSQKGTECLREADAENATKCRPSPLRTPKTTRRAKPASVQSGLFVTNKPIGQIQGLTEFEKQKGRGRGNVFIINVLNLYVWIMLFVTAREVLGARKALTVNYVGLALQLIVLTSSNLTPLSIHFDIFLFFICKSTNEGTIIKNIRGRFQKFPA